MYKGNFNPKLTPLDDSTTDPDDIISMWKITNIKTGRIMYDKLTCVFIEMPKFTKDPDALPAHVF
ncbi:Rpn family recombination-promoting nuclease/putative transposase [Myxococcota bacterium]|nr:Rpn family recombination-promoting nuclease/putative transposase [Myxococcota bacterium]MBU1534199.1 Rpn family recombination-promoting nuclease/putative transposase [Myxococcota bacterium]